jgi:hypothetical protein
VNVADQSQVSTELNALASDVLQFLRRIEAAATTACEDQKRDLLFTAWRIMKRAGETSEIAKEGTLSAEIALERIAFDAERNCSDDPHGLQLDHAIRGSCYIQPSI